MKSGFVRSYQFVVVYPASLVDKEQKKDLKVLTDFVEAKGAKVSFAEWGEKSLAYRIKGYQTAKYWLGDMKVSEDKPMAWDELKTFLSRDKIIIRYLILKS